MQQVPTEHIHLITQIIRKTNSIFSRLGFEVVEGPELETSYNNFDALNIPAGHPARDLQDTFWLKEKQGDNELLRTHTSSIQIRYIEEHKPPIKIIAPGKVFRNEATDSTHETQFHQIEGLYIDKNVSLSMLQGVFNQFFNELFEKDIKLRARPGYFPFVEPGLEIDIFWENPKTNEKKWIEILGAGMIHPAVLRSGKIDAREYSGFAFGVGIERIAMLLYGVEDVREFFAGDLRLNTQF